MTQNNNLPDVITRASLTGAVGPGAGESPESKSAGPGPTDDWEGFFHFLERFEGHLTRIFQMIERVKAMERGESPGPAQGQSQKDQDRPAPQSSVKPIPAIKAYQVALGLLAGLPEDTTVKTMLEFARGNKEIVLVQLDEYLKKLQEGG